MNHELAQQIRNRRILLGITQEDLGEISGVSVRTIKATEKGDGNPTIDVLSRLLESVGLKLTTVERVSNG
jgi:transcriptional regulator with XRE-family HTH domain